jgi:hypothetical protein
MYNNISMMSKTSRINYGKSSTQPAANGNIYYNITIPNNQVNPTPTAIPATFFEVRSTSVVPDPPNTYTLSIIRAKIPTTIIPLKIIEIVPAPGNTNINLTAYTVTLTWNGFTSQQNIIWIPQDAMAPVPPSTISDSYVNSDFAFYYSLRTVQHFIVLINTAFAAAAADLATHGAPTANPPFLYLNPDTKLISIYADANYNSNGPTPVKIFMNLYLGGNFNNSFDILYTNLDAPNGENFQYLVYDINGKNTEIVGGVSYFVMTQAFNTFNNMSSFDSVIFTSTSLPVRYELVSAAVPAATPISGDFFPILQDIQIDTFPIDVGFNVIQYNPTAEFRRLQMTALDPDALKTIDISIFWKDNYGNIYPLFIGEGQIASIKLLFEKIR